MMGPEDHTEAVDTQLKFWRQGDVSLDTGLEFMHIADLSLPHSPASLDASLTDNDKLQTRTIVPVFEEVVGFVLLTQTCDIVRPCRDRPFVEVAPLVKEKKNFVEEVNRLKRPAFAYIPTIAKFNYVADLDRVMTVEKAVVANWTRTPGWSTDAENREFARAIARKHSRFAFPDDFVRYANRFMRRIIKKHNRNSVEGEHLRALREIRVQAVPSWNEDNVALMIWFIKNSTSTEKNFNWPLQIEQWTRQFDKSGRFRIDSAVACNLYDITAFDYVESDVLDLDSLSIDGSR